MKQAVLHETFLVTGISTGTLGGHRPKLQRRQLMAATTAAQKQAARSKVTEFPEQPQRGLRALLASLDRDSARAWEAYDTLRKKLTAYFENNHHSEPEALADEVLDRVAARSDVATLSNIAEFAFGVARNVRKENLRQASLRVDIEDLDLMPDANPEPAIIDNISAATKLECFQRCLQQLTAEERELIHRYFPSEDADLEGQRRRLASDLGITMGALRTRVARIREKLERHFKRSYHSRHHRKVSCQFEKIGHNVTGRF